jgi:hypothetical protein
MLRANNYKARDLAHEIDLLLNDTDPMKALPRKFRETVDAIRVFGNFAAHPTDNKATLELIEVESHEAEWCLETIEELFEHFYVGPVTAKAKKPRWTRSWQPAASHHRDSLDQRLERQHEFGAGVAHVADLIIDGPDL